MPSRPSTTSSQIRLFPTNAGAPASTRFTIPMSDFNPSELRLPRRPTTPTCCTSSARSEAPAKGRASCRMAFCFAAMLRPTSGAHSFAGATSRASSDCPLISSTASGIPACIVVIDKEDAHARKGIFMIDASVGFMKDGPKNRLRDMDIHKIVDVFNKRLELPKYSRMVGFEEIEKNEFNLNLPRYIDSQQ